MKKLVLMLGGAVVLALQSCAVTTQSYDIQAKSNTTTYGKAIFKEYKNGKVNLVLKVNDLTEGEHAVHIHEKGDCSSPDGLSAGPHWNPTHEKHGKWGHGEHHKGDIGNILANKQGVGVLKFSTDEWCLNCSDETKNVRGKSIIIHAKADDFKTQPTGDAGGRVGCVEIK